MTDGLPIAEVRQAAQRYLRRLGSGLEPQLSGAVAGNPVLVRTVEGAPSYWLVPVSTGEALTGAVRVALSGELISLGPHDPARSGPTVTGISAAEAKSRAATSVKECTGEEIDQPIFVCDGPPGREVWLVPVERDHRLVRRLFVSRGGIYERGPSDANT
jgi:hypothetical protein